MTYQGHAVTLLPGRLRGYRQWGLTDLSGDNHLVLTSITAKTRWPWTPQVEARCHAEQMRMNVTRHPADEVPKRNCTCGIYAKHNPARLPRHSNPVTGVIEGWGPHTEIGEEGFRSRYARIVALYVTPLETPHVTPYYGLSADECPTEQPVDATAIVRAKLSEIYRVPVFDDLAKMIEEYPPIDISDLLPPPEPIEPFKLGSSIRSPSLARRARKYAFTFVMTGGTWYAAGAGFPEPNMRVAGGAFAEPVDSGGGTLRTPAGWHFLINAREAVIANDMTGLHVGSARILIEDHVARVFHQQLFIDTQQLCWESDDHSTRVIFHRVRSSNNDIICESVASGAAYMIYAAGPAPVSPAKH